MIDFIGRLESSHGSPRVFEATENCTIQPMVHMKKKIFTFVLFFLAGLRLNGYSHDRVPYLDSFCPDEENASNHDCLKDISFKTPFGAPLGVNHDIVAYSNCRDFYISKEISYFQGFYCGIKGQCVEYARRWFEGVKGLTFPSIHAAFQIWDLPIVIALIDDTITYPFQSAINGGQEAPGVGDLLIYAYRLPDFPFGHVAVIVGVDILEGYVDIAEQNYTNDVWVDPLWYARRIKLILIDGCYTIIDEDFNANDHTSIGGVILGWKKVLESVQQSKL